MEGGKNVTVKGSNMRAVIWTAVSSRPQATEDRTSLESQVKRAREVIAAQGWQEICEPLRVDGHSRRLWTWREAADAMDAYQQLWDLAKNGSVDILIVKDHDRIGRRGSLVQELVGRLNQYGVRVYGVVDHDFIEDKLLLAIQGWRSEKAVDDLCDAWTHGMAAKAENGGHCSSLPYGYQLKIVGHGMNETKTVVPDEEAAALVRQTFREFVGGRALTKLAEDFRADAIAVAEGRGEERPADRRARLEAEGRRKPRDLKRPWRDPWGGSWPNSCNALRRMFSNRFYVGEVIFQRWNHDAEGRPTTKRGKPIESQGVHEPIIDPQLFAQAQRELKHRRSLQTKFRFTRYALSSRIFCSMCGRPMRVLSRGTAAKMKYYVCKRNGCERNAIRVDRLEAMAQWTLVRFPTVHKRLADQLTNTEDDGARRKLERRIASVTGRLSKQEATVNRWADAFERGEMEGRVLQERSSLAERKLAALRADLADLEERLAAVPTGTDLAEGLATFAEKRAADLAGRLTTRDGAEAQAIKEELAAVHFRMVVERGEVLVLVGPWDRPATVQQFAKGANPFFGA